MEKSQEIDEENSSFVSRDEFLKLKSEFEILRADFKAPVENQQTMMEEVLRENRHLKATCERLRTDLRFAEQEKESLITALRLLNCSSTQTENTLGREPLASCPISDRQEVLQANGGQIAHVSVSQDGNTKYNNKSKKKKVKNMKNNENLPRIDPATCKSATENRRVATQTSTIIAGDSILKHLVSRKLSKENNRVKISSFPGCTTSDMFDFVKPLLR